MQRADAADLIVLKPATMFLAPFSASGSSVILSLTFVVGRWKPLVCALALGIGLILPFADAAADSDFPLWQDIPMDFSAPRMADPEFVDPEEESEIEEEPPMSMMSFMSVPESIDAEVQALADALGAGQATSGEASTAKAVRIFNWVRNTIDYEHYFGLKKGASLTLLEGSGNDFDQAALLRDLLVATGYPAADVKLRLRGHRIDYADLVPWLGLGTDPCPGQTYLQAFDRTIAQDFPGIQGLNDDVAKQATFGVAFLRRLGSSSQGGDPSFWPDDLPGKANLLFDRLWVQLVVNGTTYDLDPSYKTYEKVTANHDVLAAVEYSRAALLTAAGGSGNADSVSGLKEEDIADHLAGLTDALLVQLKTEDWRDLAVADLVKSRRIVRQEITSLSEAFPLDANFSGTNKLFDSTSDSTLDPYKSTVRFQYGDIDYTIPTADLKGRKITLTFSSSTAELRFDDGDPVATATVSGSSFELAINVKHPRFAFPFTTPTPLVFRKNNAFVYTIVYGFTPSARLLQKRYEQLRAYLGGGKADSSREVRTELLNIMGLTWLYQSQLCTRVLADQNDVIPLFFNRFGRVAQEEGYYVDMGLQNSADSPSDQSQAGPRYDNVLQLGSLFSSAMEHGVIEQLQPGSSAVSTVKILRKAGLTTSNPLFLARATNWSTVVSQLTNYSTATKTSLGNAINNDGAQIFLPKNGSVTEGIWNGTGFVLRLPHAAGMIISGGYSGGFSTATGTVISAPISARFNYNPAATYTSSSIPNQVSVPPPPTLPRNLAMDPVDMATGEFTYAAEDMTTGTEDAPRGLSFSRYYSSNAVANNDQKLGFGWTHNFHLRAQERTAAEDALGQGSPQNAASFLVAMLVGSDLYRADATPKEWGVATFVVKWLVDQMKDNAVSVRLGKDVFQFLKKPDGTYEPPPGSTLSLAKVSNKYEMTQRFGNTVKFDAEGKATKIVDADGKEMTIAYNGNDTVRYVEDSNDRRFTFTYTSGNLTKITDSTNTTRFIQFGYDDKKNLTTFTDPEGKISRYDYEVSGDPGGTTKDQHRIVRLRNDDSETITQNVYDSLGRVERQFLHGDTNKTFRLYYTGRDNYEVNPEGGVTHYFYDERGRPAGTRDAEGNVTSISYDAQDRMVTQTSGNETTVYHYDAFNNIRQIDHPRGGGSTILDYETAAPHRLDLVTDPNGFQTDYVYFTSGADAGKNRPQSIISAKGTADESTTTYQYISSGPAQGRIWKVTDGDSLVTEYAYDSLGHPDWVKAPGGFTTQFTYNSRGDLSYSASPVGRAADFTYNKRRQLVQTHYNDLGGVEDRTYDNQGRLQSVVGPVQSDSARVTNTFTYSPTDKVLLEKVNGVTVADHRYDKRDWEEKVFDAAGRETQFPRYANGELHQTLRPGSRTSTYGYDEQGRLTSQTDPGANTGSRAVGFVYDTNGDNKPRTVFTDSDHRTTTSVFDRLGRLRFQTNKKANSFEFRYDGLGRQTHVITPLDASLGRATVAGYTDNGRPSVVTEPSGDTATYAYNSTTGRLESVTYQKAGGSASTVNYTGYDDDGNLLTLNEGGAGGITRTYDARGRVKSFTINGQTIGYRYYQDGRLYKIIYPGGSESLAGHVIYGYWPNGRLKHVSDRLDSISSPRLTTYYWRTDGRLEKIERPNGTIREIGYDAAGRPDSILEKTSGGTVIAQYSIGYYPSDDIRTLTSVPQIPPVQLGGDPAADMTYNIGEQLATFNGQTVTHDADGNMTNGPLPSGTFGTYVYDSRNRLQSAGGLTYSYDAEGNRIGIGGTETQSFAVDPHSGGLSRVLTRTKNSQTTRYVYGLGLLYEVNASGQAIHYHYDQVGNTVALTNQSASVIEGIVYAPYGTIRYRQSNHDTPFLYGGFFGVMTDSNGLLSMRARYYNPLTRRFLNTDPARNGWNWYAYAAGNPTIFNDPTGLDAYYGYTDAHAWAAVDTPAGNVVRFDFRPGGGGGYTGDGLIDNTRDLKNNWSVPGQAQITISRRLDDHIKFSDTVIQIPQSAQEDLMAFRRMVEISNNPPAYKAALNNCGHQATQAIFGNPSAGELLGLGGESYGYSSGTDTFQTFNLWPQSFGRQILAEHPGSTVVRSPLSTFAQSPNPGTRFSFEKGTKGNIK